MKVKKRFKKVIPPNQNAGQPPLLLQFKTVLIEKVIPVHLVRVC